MVGRYFLLFTFTWASQFCIAQNAPDTYPFQIGERLEFKVKYGWFTIGKATVRIPGDTIINGEPSYKVNVVGRTAGLLGFFSNTTDTFDGTVSQYDFKPYEATQNFQEGNKRDVQTNVFDYETRRVVVEKIDYENEIVHPPKEYKLDSSAFDMLSSYLYLRSLDFNAFNVEDSVMMKVFFGKKHWEFGIEYGGQEVIKTNFGKMKTHKFYILFPVSSTFPEEKSVMIWTTMDENQLPLKIKAELKFGQVTCELEEFANIRKPISKSG